MLLVPTLPFLISLASPVPDHAPARDSHTLLETALAAGSFSTLTAALEAADLAHVLQEGGPFTVFAPTDAAFAALPAEQLEALLAPAGRDALKAVLKQHVVSGRLDAQHVVARTSVDVLAGGRLAVRASGGGVQVGGASVVEADIECSNGVIHVIDEVLLPPQSDLAETAEAAGSFATLLKACEAAGLVDALKGDDPLTVFAPTDEAFAQLSRNSLRTLLRDDNREALKALLAYHVVPGRRFAEVAPDAAALTPLAGDPYGFRLQDGRLCVAGAQVLANDLQASNGVIHVIDRVLVPSDLPLSRARLIIGFQSGLPGQALAEQLGIDRKNSLLVTSVDADDNAGKYGLQRYDVITGMNGGPATDARLDDLKKELGFGAVIHFTVIRGGEEITLDIPVGIAPH